ncbi:MAG: C25 family cysteine peptidase [Acidobacteriota bacterium]
MKSKVENSKRTLIIAACVFLAGALVFAPSASLQQGGNFILKPSVVAGGGGSSTGGTTTVAGTVGQAVLGLSSGGQFSLNSGFWQGGGAAPCSVPTITFQPSNQAACEGGSATFSLTASDGDAAYQWRKDGVNIPNATLSSLTCNNVTAADAGVYDVVVSKPCGSSTTSIAATLTVHLYSLAPASASSPSSGGGGSFNLNAGGNCPWTAVCNNAWITVNPGVSGSGNGVVGYSVAPNTGGGRIGTITVAGKTFTVTQAAPTAITLISFAATRFDDGVLLEWRTGLEVDNLGFNLYRDEGGKPARINLQPIAGSALRIGQGITVGSGCAYTWWDKTLADCGSQIADCLKAAYWLEDLDLNGQSTWHGPFTAAQPAGKQRPANVEKIRTLAALSISEAPSPSVPVESRAALASDSALSPARQVQSIVASSANSLKLRVKREAWYKVSAHELFDSGLATSVDPRNLQLFVDGKQQPIKITGGDDGRFDSADSVEFYGTGLDSPFSDLRTYYLVAGKQAGLRTSNIQSSAHPSPSGSFPFTVERRDRTIYFSALRNGDNENFFGAVVAGQPVNQSITLNHIVPAEHATLEIALQGVTYVPHIVALQLNGSDVGQLAFQGQAHEVSTFQIASSLLTEGINQISLVARGGPSDVSLVDYVRLTYQHSFTIDDDRLKFSAPAGQPVTIRGFTSESIRILDVTDPSAVREISGYLHKDESGLAVSLTAPGKGLRSLLALTDDKVSRVPGIALDYPSTLANPAQGADLLVITRRDLFDSVRPLVALRQKEGLSVAVVDIDDIYDEFSFGQKSTRAVKDFLAMSRTGWKKPVRYVLVLGDASYDPKNYLGLGDFDLVPTLLVDTAFMETASDDSLTDFNGDGIADLPIGRLPVRNSAEASLMISKIFAYEQSFPAEEAVLVSDLNDGIDFERSSERLVPLIPRETRVIHIKRGQLGDQATRAALIDLINRGQRIVNYNGHGSLDQWRGGVFSGSDALQLTNQKHPALFVSMNCLNGYFHDPGSDSLGEALMKSTGGAAAVWASSAMTYADSQAPMNAEFYRQLFASSRPRLGDAAAKAKTATPDLDVRRSWVLFGDPTMRFK